MTEQELTERLAEAGYKHDGHVTNGSLAAQMRVVSEFIEEANKKCWCKKTKTFAEVIAEEQRPGLKL